MTVTLAAVTVAVTAVTVPDRPGWNLLGESSPNEAWMRTNSMSGDRLQDDLFIDEEVRCQIMRGILFRGTDALASPTWYSTAVVGGTVVGLLCAVLLVMFIIYRMRKKDEGSYALDEPKRSPHMNQYNKNPPKEFYA
ncbi:PREDICTED: syndecan-like [Priapulus caudatus]|uniref:Syndecan n=1 Tax=Priapulus caudatus TaxID=37621 RepID=A0ABM1DYS4_PRICU|nr:PREDICTED: syndecan-like [Priapulus caudatus]